MGHSGLNGISTAFSVAICSWHSEIAIHPENLLQPKTLHVAGSSRFYWVDKIFLVLARSLLKQHRHCELAEGMKIYEL
jgi:hypothetical protein